MKPVITIGNQDFRSIRENDYFYIDKTNFIKEWWENGDVATLITRPRRFGKTLNMNIEWKFMLVKIHKVMFIFRKRVLHGKEKI